MSSKVFKAHIWWPSFILAVILVVLLIEFIRGHGR